jgi:hypothetical protein
LFSDKNEKAYIDNAEKNKKGADFDLLQDIINYCLRDNPESRPDFP